MIAFKKPGDAVKLVTEKRYGGTLTNVKSSENTPERTLTWPAQLKANMQKAETTLGTEKMPYRPAQLDIEKAKALAAAAKIRQTVEDSPPCRYFKMTDEGPVPAWRDHSKSILGEAIGNMLEKQTGLTYDHPLEANKLVREAKPKEIGQFLEPMIAGPLLSRLSTHGAFHTDMAESASEAKNELGFAAAVARMLGGHSGIPITVVRSFNKPNVGMPVAQTGKGLDAIREHIKTKWPQMKDKDGKMGSGYELLSRDCQTFSSDLFSFIAGKDITGKKVGRFQDFHQIWSQIWDFNAGNVWKGTKLVAQMAAMFNPADGTNILKGVISVGTTVSRIFSTARKGESPCNPNSHYYNSGDGHCSSLGEGQGVTTGDDCGKWYVRDKGGCAPREPSTHAMLIGY